jgi:hypothetical protein
MEVTAFDRSLQFVNETAPDRTVTAALDLLIFCLIEKPSKVTTGALITKVSAVVSPRSETRPTATKFNDFSISKLSVYFPAGI